MKIHVVSMRLRKGPDDGIDSHVSINQENIDVGGQSAVV